MFIGHYGVSFACKAAKPAIPLWVLFVAVQLVDVAWAVLVLLGIEKVRIVPGITATNPFDLYYMPFTHSLPGAALWSVGAAVTYRALAPAQKWAAAAIVGSAVFSHWILDLLVHRPDLALYDDTYKVGFGLWNYPTLAFTLEIALLFGGIALFLRTTEPKDSIDYDFGPRRGRAAGLCLFRTATGFRHGVCGHCARTLFRLRRGCVLARRKTHRNRSITSQ